VSGPVDRLIFGGIDENELARILVTGGTWMLSGAPWSKDLHNAVGGGRGVVGGRQGHGSPGARSIARQRRELRTCWSQDSIENAGLGRDLRS